MQGIYNFVSGPLVWLSFFIFFGGCLYRLVTTIKMTRKKEPFMFTYLSWKYSLRSILHWITPFGTENWKQNPVMTVVTFLFHICLLITPLFLLAHIIMWDQAWNMSWLALPEGVADIMTLIVIAGCLYFLYRRLFLPEVKYVTDYSDFVILAITAAPFITGFLAYHQIMNYELMLILHILAGEIMLISIPFTRLIHMVFSVLSRAYTGSEFGAVRHARDW